MNVGVEVQFLVSDNKFVRGNAWLCGRYPDIAAMAVPSWVLVLPASWSW